MQTEPIKNKGYVNKGVVYTHTLTYIKCKLLYKKALIEGDT